MTADLQPDLERIIRVARLLRIARKARELGGCGLGELDYQSAG